MTNEDPTLDVARNLRAIVELSAHLTDQAAHKAGGELPGGDALVMLAPVASPEAWQHRVDTIERLWWARDDDTPQPDVAIDEDAYWEPPLQTLLFWSEQWRWDRNATSDLPPTIASEAAWLGQVVQWAVDNDPHFDDFAKDMHAAKRRLEAVLYAGERDEQSRVPCVDCTLDRDGNAIQVRLVRRFGPFGREERWHCPRCARAYDVAAFVRAMYQHLASVGADRFVPLNDAAQAVGVSPDTVRTWIKRAKVTVACDVNTRRLVVWWPQVREQRHALGDRMTTL